MGWMLSGGCSWFCGFLEDEGDDGAEGGTGEVVFGEFVMERKFREWFSWVSEKCRELFDEVNSLTKMYGWMKNVEERV